jgi:hypothetical protein
MRLECINALKKEGHGNSQDLKISVLEIQIHNYAPRIHGHGISNSEFQAAWYPQGMSA